MVVYLGELCSGIWRGSRVASSGRWVAGVELASPASLQSTGHGRGGVALRSPTPATLDCNLLVNQARIWRGSPGAPGWSRRCAGCSGTLTDPGAESAAHL